MNTCRPQNKSLHRHYWNGRTKNHTHELPFYSTLSHNKVSVTVNACSHANNKYNNPCGYSFSYVLTWVTSMLTALYCCHQTIFCSRKYFHWPRQPQNILTTVSFLIYGVQIPFLHHKKTLQPMHRILPTLVSSSTISSSSKWQYPL